MLRRYALFFRGAPLRRHAQLHYAPPPPAAAAAALPLPAALLIFSPPCRAMPRKRRLPRYDAYAMLLPLIRYAAIYAYATLSVIAAATRCYVMPELITRCR